MKNNKMLRMLLLILNLVLGAIIVLYYWSNESVDSIKQIPIYVMLLALGYIFVQIAKRYFFKKQNWWDWLYYIGIIAMMVPTVIADTSNMQLMELLTDYGTLFLIIPVFFDGKQVIDGKQ